MKDQDRPIPPDLKQEEDYPPELGGNRHRDDHSGACHDHGAGICAGEGDGMNSEDIISMAKEALLGSSLTHDDRGLRIWIEGADWHDEITRFAALAYEAGAAKERDARQAAQIENEELKARLARADLEQQRAVLTEREECAKVCDNLTSEWTPEECAAAIRARKDNT